MRRRSSRRPYVLAPPAHILDRGTLEDIELGDHFIPKGTYVALGVLLVQRQEKHFERPLEFRPERWLDGSTADLHSHAYLPYGLAPRDCGGTRLVSSWGRSWWRVWRSA